MVVGGVKTKQPTRVGMYGGFHALEADCEAWVSSVGVLFTHFTNEADVNEGTN